MNQPPRKRQKSGEFVSQHTIDSGQNSSTQQGIWPRESYSDTHDLGILDTSAEKNKERGRRERPIFNIKAVADHCSSVRSDDVTNDEDSFGEVDWMLHQHTSEYIANNFLDFTTQIPSIENRPSQVKIPNPFLDAAANRYPYLREIRSELPKDGAMEGYLKLGKKSTEQGTIRPSRRQELLRQAPLVLQKSLRRLDPNVASSKIPRQLSAFDLSCNLNEKDKYLLDFCRYHGVLLAS